MSFIGDFGHLSAGQINSSMGMGVGGAGDINQSAINAANANFGQQTAYYAGQGAAYGRETGGFGGSAPQQAMGSVFDTGAPAYNDYGSKGGSYGGFGGEGATPVPIGGGGNWMPSGYSGGGSSPFDPSSYNPPAALQNNPFFNPPAPVAPQQPQISQDWNGYFTNLTSPPSSYNGQAYPLGGYPSGGGSQSKNPFSSSGPSMTFDADGNFTGWDFSGGGGHPAVPAAAPSAPNYTPDYSATQNGFGYPGPAGSVSQAFNPASYAPSTTGNAGAVLGGGSASGGYKPFAGGGPSMTFGPDGEFTGWDFSGSNAPSYNYAGATPPSVQSVLGYTPDQYLNGPNRNGAGQPYGQGYFDQTFGAANSQPQAYNPLAGGGYPGRMSSDNMANQQDYIQQLYQTLGIIDNAGEGSPAYGSKLGRDTLLPQDYFPQSSVGG